MLGHPAVVTGIMLPLQLEMEFVHMKINALIRGVVVCLFSCATIVLCGCGGSGFTGSLTGRDGDGSGPQPGATQAQITAVSPSTIAAASAPFTLTITGLNFVSSTVVMFDSQPLVTTYVSPTMLKAQVPVARITGPGNVSVIPSPQGSFNFGTTFTITQPTLSGNKAFAVTKVAIQANDMVWSPTRSLFYLSISTADPSKPGTITTLDPKSMQFGQSVTTGLNPGKLAISDEGSFLYAAFNDTYSVRRYTLSALQQDITIPLRIGTDTNYGAADIQVQPTNPRALAVARLASNVNYRTADDVTVFDDTNARAQTARGGTNIPIARLLWSGSGTLFGTEEMGGQTLYVLAVDGSGAQLKTKLQAPTSLTGTLHLGSTGSLIFLDRGYILDSSSGAGVANFPVNALQQGFSTAPLLAIDSKLNLAYFLGRTFVASGTGNYVIEAFDLTDLHLVGTASLADITGTPSRFYRWGDQGLAFLTTDSTGAGKGGVYVISGGFVTHPAE